MSRLEALPQHLLRDILRYLLLSDRVRGPPNRYLIEDYDFQVAILRTNKAINQEAANIFYQDNKWIKFRNGYGDPMETALINHETPYFKLKTMKFENHVAEVDVKPNVISLPVYGGKTTTGLLLLQDIPKFARVLRIVDFANFFGYNIKFALHTPPGGVGNLSKEDQERLLLPMEQVKGVAFRQQVTFTSTFDATLVQRVKQTMTQGVAWLRAGAAEVYDLALSMKRMGDMASNIENRDMAFAKWNDTVMFIDSTMKQNDMMDTRLESVFRCRIYALQCMVDIERQLLDFTDLSTPKKGPKFDHISTVVQMAENAEGFNAKLGYEAVPTSAIARFYRFLGIAELGLDHPVKAAKAFVKSYKIMSLSKTKQGYETAAEWKKLTATQRKAKLDSLYHDLPSNPHTLSGFKAWQGPQVASEHWVMRKLGFQGEFPYADKISGVMGVWLTNEPHPNSSRPGPRTVQLGAVKPEVLQKVVDKHRKEAALPMTQGTAMIWVSLGPNMIGQESVLDDPQAARSMENMSLNGHGGYPTQ
ncbi:hypothetical protein J4E90_010421 [Alternaria incomplexa]|uniref:uncharacterized protein n=1 Tax=Alternaria incomplexa TaxID=1187928 RepID=UPI00222110F0|nr:uncharacterized protein J4E90_010421 [Alternaria incomplexa]KAI4906528.1 hypothetical protein J4E90_010421 [Alternaria incomplexa]